MCFVRSFLIMVFFCLLGVSPAFSLDLIYPEDGTYIVRSNYMVIKAGHGIDGLTVEINGLKSGLIDISSPEYKSVFADFLILEPDFAAGKNRVKLEGFSSGQKVAGEAADIFYLNEPFGQVPDGYRPYVMHTKQREALCGSCHIMNPGNAQLAKSSAAENPCAACHKKMLNKKYVHGPAGVFQCVECHDPDSQPTRYKSEGGRAKSCNTCHLDKVKEFEGNKFVHGPVEVGMCVVCHDAHASDHPAQVVASVNDVCLGCHANLNVRFHFTQGVGRGHPVGGAPDPQDQSKELRCSSCHNPHGGETRVFISGEYSTSSMMFCQKCHAK